MTTVIRRISTHDARFPLQPGEGVDSIHSNPMYSYAMALIETDRAHTGVGFALTLGTGNELVCQAIHILAEPLIGREIEELMSDLGTLFRTLADHPQMRWLGPHKGIVHLALAAIVNGCFDLWAKTRGVPLWKMLTDLTPEQIISLLDLSYLEDVLTKEDALSILRNAASTRANRTDVIQTGYPGYDTSIGWFDYSDEQIRDNAQRALDDGFCALKLKIGSGDSNRDVRRMAILREAVGTDIKLMVDCNQQWSLPKALRVCLELAPMLPYWVEEPTHPDDVLAHQQLAQTIAPIPIAAGEHLPNRVIFKNYMQAGAMGFVQVDCVRVGGISEFITISLLARKYELPVVPHVGDMGQIHQHLVLFNHVALGHEKVLLEYVPHLRNHFVQPARVEHGVYRTPQEPGSSSDLKTNI